MDPPTLKRMRKSESPEPPQKKGRAESLKRAREASPEAQRSKRAREADKPENESLKRACQSPLEEPTPKRPREGSEPRPFRQRLVQVPRTLDGEVEAGFVYPTDNQGEAYDALVEKFPAWQEKHAARAKEAKGEYMFGNPAKKQKFKKALAAWRKKVECNGSIVYLEWSSEMGGFDGDKHFGNLDDPSWGLYLALLRWQHGLGWHHLHYPTTHLGQILNVIESWDAAYSAAGHGPAIYLTKALYDEIDKFRDEPWMFTPKETMQLEFALELRTLLDDMYEDCLEHQLLTMSCEDTILFAAALSRLPKRADQEWEDEPPTFLI